MPILSGDIKLIASQVMDDVPEGGGAPTATVIQDGVSNAIFPDVSELDRAGGRVNLRKIFVSVQTNDRDTYMGSNVIVAEPPADPNVSVTLFTTDSTFDRRTEAQSRIESYLNKGPTYPGQLYDNHIAGQRVIQIFQRENENIPLVGTVLVLVQNEELSTEFSQYCRVVSVTSALRTFTDSQGDFKAVIVSLELSDALRYDFKGSDVTRYFTMKAGTTKVRETTVADAGAYVGVVPLASAASLGDFTINAEGIYTQLVPSAQVETPIVDANPMQQTVGYSATGGSISYQMTAVFTTAQSVFIGGSILPGSLTISYSSTTLNDVGGLLYQNSTEVGSVDYENGVLSLSTNVFGTSGVTFTVTYTPATVPRVFGPSVSIDVTEQSRSLSYTKTLVPVPAQGGLMISYQVAKRWYVMRDNGAGAIVPSSNGAGAGTVNYNTGSVSLTLGALPDVGSVVLFQWSPGTAVNKVLSTALINSGKMFTELNFPMAVKPGTLSLAWPGKTATASALGVVSGDASGSMLGSQCLFSPNALPAAGTEVTATYTGLVTTAHTINPTLSGTDASTHWVYDLPPAANSGLLMLQVTLHARYVKKDAGEWASDTVDRIVTLYNPTSGSTVLAAQVGAWYSGGAGTVVGSIDWTAKTFRVSKTLELYGMVHSYTTTGDYVVDTWSNELAPHEVNSDGSLTTAGTATIYTTDELAGQTTTFTLDSFKLAAKEYVGGTAYASSFMFKLNTVLHKQGVFAGTTGQLFTAISPTNGNGTVVGSVSASGVVTMTTWTANTTNTVTDFSGAWVPPAAGVNVPLLATSLTFRTAASPIRPSSLSIQVTKTVFHYGVGGGAGFSTTETVNAASDANGDLTGGLTGTVDYENGVVRITGGGLIDVAGLKYNTVSYSYLPLDADIIGIDPVRLPSDGRVPIFRAGGFAVVGHTGSITATVSNGQTVDCARVRLSRVRVIGHDGVVINTGYSADLDAGTVTFSNVSGYSQPVTIEHRIEDMAVVRDAQISGELTFTRAITHDYPLGSYVSSALVAGDLKSRVSVLFDQATWSNTWADSVSGSSASGTYNDVLAPIAVTNAGAITERWAIVFTNTTAFNVIGEHVGVIAQGSTGTNLEVLNPSNGIPYFTIQATGWGIGWATGNVLRFNTIGAMTPVWAVRTVQQGPSSGTQHTFTILSRGDVDRP